MGLCLLIIELKTWQKTLEIQRYAMQIESQLIIFTFFRRTEPLPIFGIPTRPMCITYQKTLRIKSPTNYPNETSAQLLIAIPLKQFYLIPFKNDLFFTKCITLIQY